MVARVTNREATDKVGRRPVRVADARSADRTAGQGRHRLWRGQHGAGSRLASASAAHRDRHARRPRRAARAGADLRRREPQLTAACRRSARIRTPSSSRQAASHECDRNARSRSSAQVDRQGRGGLRRRHRARGEGHARNAVPRPRRAQDRRRRAGDDALVLHAADRAGFRDRSGRSPCPRRLPAAGAAAAPDVGGRPDRLRRRCCASAMP